MTILSELTVEWIGAAAVSAALLTDYVRNVVLVRRWRQVLTLRRERAARRVVTLDFLDEPAFDGLEDHLLIADPPDRLRRVELERVTTDERASSISAAPHPRARMSRRRGRDLRELYRGTPEPSARLAAVLAALEGLSPIRDRIIATNEELVSAVHTAALEHEREFQERFMRPDDVPHLAIRDADAIARAVRVTAEQAAGDSLMVWLTGRFAVREDGGQLVLDATITASRNWLHDIGFPVSARLAADGLTGYGSRLRPGSTVALELLGSATQFAGDPPQLSIAPLAVFARSSLYLPEQVAQLPVLLDALPRPLRALTIAPWAATTKRAPLEHKLGPERAARRALRGRGTPQWWLDR